MDRDTDALVVLGLELSEDGYSLRTPFDGDVDGDGRHVVVGGETVVTFADSDEGERARDAILAALSILPPTTSAGDGELVERKGFQGRVGEWVEICFPPKVVYDRLERRDRFVEEALELAQTLPDFTADRAHALVDYVFSRPTGVTEQEVGGAMVTLAALCHAEGIDQQHWAEVELTRISAPEVIEKIRAKQAAKPVGSALPMAGASPTEQGEQPT